MTLEENLNLLNDTKKRIKASLDVKVPQSTDDKTFGEYNTIVDGIKQFSTNIDDYTITDCVKSDDITDTSISSVNQYTKSVNIPTTVKTLGNHCFKNCSGLTEVTIPESVTSLGDSCFSYCKSLTSVTIGNSVTSLGDWCFSNCTSLTGITIPNSVTSLDTSCFSNCDSLSAITIPDYVTSLGTSCFSSCDSLKSVICKPTTPPTLGGDAFVGAPISAIYVPAESVDAYKSATNWSKYAAKIQAITS